MKDWTLIPDRIRAGREETTEECLEVSRRFFNPFYAAMCDAREDYDAEMYEAEPDPDLLTEEAREWYRPAEEADADYLMEVGRDKEDGI